MENSKIDDKKVDIDTLKEKKLNFSWSIGSIIAVIIFLLSGGVYSYSKYADLFYKSIAHEKDITELKEKIKNDKKAEDILTASNCIDLFKRIDDFKEISNRNPKDKK